MELVEAMEGGKLASYLKKKFFEITDDVEGLRKLAYQKWAHIFNKDFINHLTGDVELIKQKVFNKQWLKYEDWIYLGNKGQGGHILNKFLNIEEITHPQGIYSMAQLPDDIPFKAKVSIKSLKGEIFPKIAESTMFPKNWRLERIQEEIAYVYENTVAKGSGLNPASSGKKFRQYKFKDSSGKFDILIEIDDFGNIINAYPKI